MCYKKKSGYLLFELALVLVLIMFLAGLGLSLGGILPRMQVRGEAMKIAALLQYQWMRAVGQQETRKLVINIGENTIKDDIDGTCYRLAADVIFGTLPHAHGPPSRPDHILSSPSSFTNNEIIFYPDGAVTAGSLYIRDRGRKSMYAVTVPLPTMFYVRVYAYGRGRWNPV